MSNHLMNVLQQWLPLKDKANWVLGTVYKTDGPAYRKAGAMMLFSDEGHQFGMLSGGCLESDIHLQARKVILTQKATTLSYDGSDEDDIAFQLGIGCGGTVHILLQPLSAGNGYLDLETILNDLLLRRGGFYHQKITRAEVTAYYSRQPSVKSGMISSLSTLVEKETSLWLSTYIEPPLHLLVVGGGIDARPVVTIAHQLGWHVTLWDPRPANGRPEYFPCLYRRLSSEANHLGEYCEQEFVNAMIVMSHNIKLDADALVATKGYSFSYLALLGPSNRKKDVLLKANLRSMEHTIAGPAGLDIGAELPETIALAMLAECQAAVTNTTAASISQILPVSQISRHKRCC